MRKLLSLLVLLCILAAAAAYGWLWYQTSRYADQMVTSLRPFADVQYERVYVWPRGQVGVQELRLRPHAVGETFLIESVGIRAEHLPQLVETLRTLQRGEKPEQLGVVVRGARIGLEGPLMTMLDEHAKQAAETAPENQLSALACGDPPSSSSGALRRLGYRELLIDTAMTVRLHEQAVALQMETETKDMARATIDMRISHPAGASRNPDEVRLAEFHLNYHDMGYQARQNRYCAQFHDDDPQAYIQAHVDAATTLLRRDFDLRLTPALREAYARMMQDGASASFSLQPDQPLVLEHLRWYQPADALALLQPSLYVGGTAVPLDGLLSRDPPTPEELARERAADKAEQQSAPEAAPSEQARAPAESAALRFQATELEALPEYLGRHARVELRSGEVREGVIESVTERELRLRRRVGSGSLTYPVELDQVTALEVWR